MKIPKYKGIKITAIFLKEYYKKVWNRLKKAGIYNIHMENARYPVLGIKKGFNSLFSSEPIIDYPMVVFSLIVLSPIEKDILSIIRDAAELDHPGHGSVFSEEITLYHENSLFFVSDTATPVNYHEKFFTGFTGIVCILQRGLGQDISRILLENGIGAPTITYGTGTGLRDKLGLLKITIPREKDILLIIVNSADSHHVMDFIIETGKLEHPGRGFIYEFPIKQGLINTRVSLDSSKQAANIEQIIAAVDKLYGGVEWRKKSPQIKGINPKRNYFKGIDIHLTCNEGYCLELIQKLRKLGVTGSTMRNPRLVCQSQPEEKDLPYKLSPAREACNMLVPESSVTEIVEYLQDLGTFGDKIQGMVYATHIPRAFTYQGFHKKEEFFFRFVGKVK